MSLHPSPGRRGGDETQNERAAAGNGRSEGKNWGGLGSWVIGVPGRIISPSCGGSPTAQVSSVACVYLAGGKREPVRAAIRAWRQRPPPYRTQPNAPPAEVGGAGATTSPSAPGRFCAPRYRCAGRPSSRRA
jgi:hypothetical protein